MTYDVDGYSYSGDSATDIVRKMIARSFYEIGAADPVRDYVRTIADRMLALRGTTFAMPDMRASEEEVARAFLDEQVRLGLIEEVTR